MRSCFTQPVLLHRRKISCNKMQLCQNQGDSTNFQITNQTFVGDLLGTVHAGDMLRSVQLIVVDQLDDPRHILRLTILLKRLPPHYV